MTETALKLQYEAIPLFLLPVVSLVFMFVLWRRPAQSGSLALLVLIAAAAVWSLGEAVELSANNLGLMVLAAKFEYIGILSIPSAWFVFSLQFSQLNRWVTPATLCALCIVPVLGIVLVATNEWHRLVWTETWIATHGSLTAFGAARGFFYWVIVAHAYTLLTAGTALLARSVIHRHRLHRRQATLLLVMVLVPLAINLMYQLKLGPVPHLDLTPMAFSVCALVLTWDFLRYGLLSSRVPVEKDQIIQSIRDGIVVLDLDRCILDMNASAQRMLGGDLKQIWGTSIRNLLTLPPDFPGTMPPAASPVVTSSRSLVSPELYLEVSASPLSLRFAGLVGFVLLVRDETERRKIDEALRESEARLRAVSDNLPGSMVYQIVRRHDGRRRFLYVSAAVDRLNNFTAQDVLRDSSIFYAQILEEDRGIVTAAEEASAENLSMLDVVVRMKGSSGYMRWMRLSAAPRKLPDGRIIWDGIQTDVTTQKNFEDELLRSEEKFAAVFQNSSNGILLTSFSTGRIIDANETLLGLAGYKREDIVGKTAIGIGLWSNSADHEACLAALTKDAKIQDYEAALRIRLTNLPHLVSAVVVDLKGVKCVLWELRDVSAVKKAEQEQEKLRSQLYRAQKMESVGRLAGGIAHDFNNILAVILGYNEIASGELATDSSTVGHLREIKMAGDRARDLVRQLLAFSRKQVLDIRVLDLNAVVHSLEKMLPRLIGEDVAIEFGFQSEAVCVKADAGQLEQVLLNLCVNARDAMPNGGALHIGVSTEIVDAILAASFEELKPGPYAVVTVRDTGTGMDESTRLKVFDPFFTTKEEGKGTGLGLAMVFGIVTQHGGEIRVESELGSGTTFRIYLPEFKTPTTAPVVEDAEPPLHGNGEVVLVLEDDKVVRTLVCRLLSRRGYNVVEAATADECFTLAKQMDSMDLLITDVIMPDMNGKQVRDRIALNRPDLKTLFISGYPDHVIASHGVLEPDINLLSKPFSEAALCRRVREVLEKQRTS